MVSQGYDDELNLLSRKLADSAALAAAHDRPPLQKDLQTLSNLCVSLRFLVEQRNVNEAPAAIRILYAKLTDCLVGVTVLLNEGLPGPAAAIVRSLFETSVHLQVLLKADEPERCQLFEDFIYVQRSRVSPESGVPESQMRENEEKLAAVRANYHPDEPYSWCWKIVPGKIGRKKIPRNPSLRDLCIHIGHEEYYDNIYGLLSDVIHPVRSYEMWIRRADGHMELGPKFNQHTRLVAHLASVLTVDVVVCLLSFLKPPDGLELKRHFVAQIL